MKLHLITDRLIRSVSSGQNSFDSKYGPEYVSAMVPSLAGQAYIIFYNGSKTMAASKRISGDWTWPHSITLDPAIQVANSDFLRFALPSPPVRINNRTNGLVYCGQKDVSIQFKEAFNRGDIANLKQRGFLGNQKQIAYIIKSNFIDVFGNPLLKEIDIDIVPQNILAYTSFDRFNDEYPISEDGIAIMELLFQQSQGINLGTKPDQILNNSPVLP